MYSIRRRASVMVHTRRTDCEDERMNGPKERAVTRSSILRRFSSTWSRYKLWLAERGLPSAGAAGARAGNGEYRVESILHAEPRHVGPTKLQGLS